MKSHRLGLILLCTLCACVPATLALGETVKFETVLYLFKSESIPHIDFRKALRGPAPLSGEGIVITPPATVVFDNEELVLGANYTWNGGQTVPARFFETKLPAIVTALGQPATIRAVVPVQYLEKMPDGSLRVREVAGNLPEIPHYALTLTARPATDARPGNDYDLIIRCQMDFASMQGREKIPGIDLEVGRPITARFDRNVEFWGRKGEWFGLMADQEGGDYALLMLLKVSPGDQAPASATTGAKAPQVEKTDPARVGISGYSVAVPDPSHWRQKKVENGIIFENRADHGFFGEPSRGSRVYRAGFSVVPAPAFPDRKSFLDFVKQAIKEGADTPGYMAVKDDFQEAVRNGLWVVECYLVRDYWHRNTRGEVSTDREGPRIRILYAVDPNDSNRVVVVWYSWLGTSFDQTRFDAESSAFIGSLQKAPR